MVANFPCGPIRACPDLLEAIDRPAFVAAVIRHATSLPIHGEAVVTHHETGEVRFRIETDARRRSTVVRLG